MFHVPEAYRNKTHPILGTTAEAGNNGLFFIRRASYELRAIASDATNWTEKLGQLKWEHVSVSLPDRIPSWIDMCFIKNLFWDEEDCVLQFHPPKSQYVNEHEFCLHLWRPIDFTIPLPPLDCI